MTLNETVEVRETEVFEGCNSPVGGNIFKNVFNLPVWQLRHSLVSKYIENLGIKTVLDIGCAEGTLINRLSRSSQIQYLAGIDFDEKILQSAQCNVQPELIQDSISYHRKNPLIVQLYKQNILEQFNIQQFHSVELVTLIQFIQHVKEDDLDYLCQLVFCKLNPKYVMITTPNQQFNVHFRFKDGQMRHKDHIFQWDRRHFLSFCSKIETQYFYSFQIFGVGQHINDSRFGDCSQGAIFTSKKEKKILETSTLKSLKALKEFRYPFWKDNMGQKIRCQLQQIIQRNNYQAPQIILKAFIQSKIAKKIMEEKQEQQSSEMFHESFKENNSFTIDWLIQTLKPSKFYFYCPVNKYVYYEYEESQNSEFDQMEDYWHNEVHFEQSKQIMYQEDKEIIPKIEIVKENDNDNESSEW